MCVCVCVCLGAARRGGSQENPTSGGEYVGRTFGPRLSHGRVEQVATYGPPIRPRENAATIRVHRRDLTSHFGADDDDDDDKLDNNGFACVFTLHDARAPKDSYNTC